MHEKLASASPLFVAHRLAICSNIIIGAYLDIIIYHHSVALCSVIAAIVGENTLKLIDPLNRNSAR